jgi:hypothetical protein
VVPPKFVCPFVDLQQCQTGLVGSVSGDKTVGGARVVIEKHRSGIGVCVAAEGDPTSMLILSLEESRGGDNTNAGTTFGALYGSVDWGCSFMGVGAFGDVVGCLDLMAIIGEDSMP